MGFNENIDASFFSFFFQSIEILISLTWGGLNRESTSLTCQV